MVSVSLTKCTSYDQAEVDLAIQKSFSAISGLANYIKPGQRVLIKPNMLMGLSAEKGATTHPSTLRAVIKAVKALGAIPIVGDSPGFESFKRVAEKCGIMAVINAEQVSFSEFNQAKEIEFKEGFVCRRLSLVKDVFDVDCIINLAKLKSHGFTGITAAVKNLFGCIHGLTKSQFHVRYPNKNDFDLMMLDLLRIIKPSINIVDAVVAMEGEGGPSTGSLRKMGLILCGTDAVAVDSVCAALTGKQPLDFNFLRLAFEKNIGQTDLAKIEIIGEKLADYVCTDFKHIKTNRSQMIPPWVPKFIVEFVRGLLLDRPVVQKDKCIKCGACSTVCASKAITPKNGTPQFNYSKCIRCFCCQEMCKYKAIKVKRSILSRFFLL
ncbi:MAG: DUF362 domain-containing protein [Candidatus Margulisiibacteriota bacterium]